MYVVEKSRFTGKLVLKRYRPSQVPYSCYNRRPYGITFPSLLNRSQHYIDMTSHSENIAILCLQLVDFTQTFVASEVFSC